MGFIIVGTPIDSSTDKSGSVSETEGLSRESSLSPSIMDVAEAFSIVQKFPGQPPHIHDALTDSELKRITMRVTK